MVDVPSEGQPNESDGNLPADVRELIDALRGKPVFTREADLGNGPRMLGDAIAAVLKHVPKHPDDKDEPEKRPEYLQHLDRWRRFCRRWAKGDPRSELARRMKELTVDMRLWEAAKAGVKPYSVAYYEWFADPQKLIPYDRMILVNEMREIWAAERRHRLALRRAAVRN